MREQKLNKEIRKFVQSRRVKNPVNVTFTELQVRKGLRLDNITSERNFRHFKNKLNSKLFGNGYRRFNKQIQMLVVREVSSNRRHHLHCIIEQPQRIGFKEFSDLIESVWRSTDFGYEKIHIEKPFSQLREDGWLSYIMKDRTKVDLNTSVDWINTSIFNH